MKLLYLMNWGNREGAGTQATLLLRHFAKSDDMDVSILNSTPIHAEQETVSTRTSIGTEMDGTMFFDPGGGIEMLLSTNIAETILYNSPDLVFVHSFAPYLTRALWEVKERNPEIKLVARVGVNPIEHYLLAPHFGNAESLMNAIMCWEMFDALICPSEYMVRQLSFNLSGNTKTRLIKIPVAVDMNYFIPTPYRGRVIATSGRMDLINPHIMSLTAFRRLYGLYDVRMNMIGDGAYKNIYREAANRFGIADRVDFQGWLPDYRIAQELEKSDIYLHPTISQCGVPGSVLESIAAGCLAITSDTVALREYKSLVRVDLEEYGGWFNAMKTMLDDPELATDTIAKQREELTTYDIENLILIYENCLRALVE